MEIKFSINPKKLAAGIIVGSLLIALGACTSSKPDAQSNGQAQTQQAFSQQSAANPYPAAQLTNSLERANLRERLLRYNNPSKISYLYLLSQTGGIYAYYTIKGKVSSTDSQMTTDNLIEPCKGGGSGACSVVVNAPGDDGSYGPEESGIFAFTTDGVMITWNGLYLLTDAPMKVNPASVTLDYVTGSKPSSTGSGK